MIELIETPLYSNSDNRRYKKALIIRLPKIKGYKITLILESKTFYLKQRSSNKRWNLVRKFKEEGCFISRAIGFSGPPRKYHRRKIWMSLEEVIKIMKINEEVIIGELREVDKKKRTRKVTLNL